MVAEQNMVWRAAGKSARIRLMVGRKPMSSIRSASSRTRVWAALQLHEFALQEIGEPAGSGDDHLRAPANRVQLRLFIQAADHDRGADTGAGGKREQKLR